MKVPERSFPGGVGFCGCTPEEEAGRVVGHLLAALQRFVGHVNAPHLVGGFR